MAAGSSSAKWEQELRKLSGDIADVLRKMPESVRAQAIQDVKSVLNDLRQKLPGAGGVEGEEETTDDEGGGNGDEDEQAGPAGAPAVTAQPAATATLAYGDENEQDEDTQVGSSCRSCTVV